MSQKIRKERITKAEFYVRGGFDNPALFRLQSRGGAWRYYVSLDREEAREALCIPPGFSPSLIVIDPLSEYMKD